MSFSSFPPVTTWGRYGGPSFPTHAGSITPPPAANLAAWFKADAGVTKSGADVTAWADQSGNGNDAVVGAGTSPLFVADSINGLPGITFGGAADTYLASVASSIIADASARTVFIVAKPAAPGAHIFRTLFMFRLDLPAFTCLLEPAAGAQYYYSDGVVNAYQATTPDFENTPVRAEWIAELSAGATSPLLFNVNGTTYSDPANYFTTIDSGTTGFCIGNSVYQGGSFANSQFVGDICEVLVYSVSLDPTNLALVRAYLLARYGV